MKNDLLPFRALDYLRIILFIPMAWIAYNISANLVVGISSKDLITDIGVDVWRYGFDILQFSVFIVTGTLVAPKIVRLWSGILTLINYGIATFWSVWILPSILHITMENLLLHRFLNYSMVIIPMLISIVIVINKYRRDIGCEKQID